MEAGWGKADKGPDSTLKEKRNTREKTFYLLEPVNKTMKKLKLNPPHTKEENRGYLSIEGIFTFSFLF